MRHTIRTAQFGFGKLGRPWFEYISNQGQFSTKKIPLVRGIFSDKKTHFDQVVASYLKENFKSDDYDIIFLAVPEQILDALIKVLKSSYRKSKSSLKLYHFSGSYYSKDAVGLHPVYSFSSINTDVDFKSINWVVDHKDISSEVLNLLGHKVSVIEPLKKEIYHSYLSVSANQAQLVNHLMADRFFEQTGLSKNLLKELVIQSLQNELLNEEKSFSGPWVRDAKEDQNKRIEELGDDFLSEQNNNFNRCIEVFNESK